CFYVAIGQKQSTVAQVVERLKRAGAMEYTTVIAATAADQAPIQYIAPYSGVTMAEYFRDTGRHALIVYADLTKQAQAYRQLSSLLKRPPGREAYPGDVFYLHSRSLERATKLSDDNGGGSITSLPIIETQEGDVSAYIPTNVISITDGQIALDAKSFAQGHKPAVDVGISVSRVGGKTQARASRDVSGKSRSDYAQFLESEMFTRFGEQPEARVKAQIDRGQRSRALLNQPQFQPLRVVDQTASASASTQGAFDAIAVETVTELRARLPAR
ncbi:hypothetical protein OY671_008504, partial [Metschnikowia pulcherrima]